MFFTQPYKILLFSERQNKPKNNNHSTSRKLVANNMSVRYQALLPAVWLPNLFQCQPDTNHM